MYVFLTKCLHTCIIPTYQSAQMHLNRYINKSGIHTKIQTHTYSFIPIPLHKSISVCSTTQPHTHTHIYTICHPSEWGTTPVPSHYPGSPTGPQWAGEFSLPVGLEMESCDGRSRARQACQPTLAFRLRSFSRAWSRHVTLTHRTFPNHYAPQKQRFP